MNFIIWLLPIIFMIHDFEEIIFMKPWIEKNRADLARRFPAISQKILPHYDSLTSSAFSLIVAEEFILISVVALITMLYQTYGLWFAVLMGFSIHLVVHIAQWLVFGRYVPVIVTSLLALPYVIYASVLYMSSKIISGPVMIVLSILGLLGVIFNYLFATWIARRFNDWLVHYFLKTN